jgi:GxxExxY protein
MAFEKDELTEKIIACCFKVHRELGPGFNEKVYHKALLILFEQDKIKADSEKEFKIIFESKNVGTFRCDFLIEEKVIVEIKSVTGIMPILFRQQVLSYLKASKTKTGLLVNFGNKSCDIKRYSC